MGVLANREREKANDNRGLKAESSVRREGHFSNDGCFTETSIFIMGQIGKCKIIASLWPGWLWVDNGQNLKWQMYNGDLF